MADTTPGPDQELSPEETAWLRDFLSYQASALIEADPEAQEAAKDLVSALGGSPPAENIAGWLDSETEALDQAAQEVVTESAGRSTEGKPPEAELDAELVELMAAMMGAAKAGTLAEYFGISEEALEGDEESEADA